MEIASSLCWYENIFLTFGQGQKEICKNLSMIVYRVYISWCCSAHRDWRVLVIGNWHPGSYLYCSCTARSKWGRLSLWIICSQYFLATFLWQWSIISAFVCPCHLYLVSPLMNLFCNEGVFPTTGWINRIISSLEEVSHSFLWIGPGMKVQHFWMNEFFCSHLEEP